MYFLKEKYLDLKSFIARIYESRIYLAFHYRRKKTRDVVAIYAKFTLLLQKMR